MNFNTFYNNFINEAGVVLSTTQVGASSNFKYKIAFSAKSIQELVEQAKDNSKLLEFIYSGLKSNDTATTLDNNTFVAKDIQKHLYARMAESVTLNEKSFKMVQFRSEGQIHELPISAYATDELAAAKKVIDDKVEHGLIPAGYKIISIDGEPINEEEVMVPAEDIKYSLFVVNDSDNNSIWAKAVPEGSTLRISRVASNLTKDSLDSRIKSLNIGVTSV